MENITTDREKLQFILDSYSYQSIEDICQCFLNIFGNDLSIRTVSELHKQINNCLERKIDGLDRAKSIAIERATYLKIYLEGKMWKDEESAKKNVQPQIENAQAIIDAHKW